MDIPTLTSFFMWYSIISIGIFKAIVLVFNVVPWIALSIIG